jgi:hypothetical protein
MPGPLSDIFLYNPTCEYAVANGKTSWQPNRLLQKMEADLSTLPMFLAKKGDYVLVENIPSESFLETFYQLGLELPEFMLTRDAVKSRPFLEFPKGKLKPWGWSPSAHQLLAPLKPSCSEEFLNSPVSTWKKEYRELYSKKFALEILQQLTKKRASDVFLSEPLFPVICSTQNEIENLIKIHGQLMIKAPWSSSGRGLQPIAKTPVHPKVWEKVMGIINDQGFVMVEPLLDKALDLAFQFELTGGKVFFLGISNFVADKKGQYLGNHLNGLPDNLDREIVAFAKAAPALIIQPLIETLENSGLAKNYEGNFGVDTLIYRDKNHNLKINPCLEINVRQNMGLLSLRLETLVHPEKKAMFRTYYQPGVSFYQFKKEMEEKFPAHFSEKKLVSGFLSLTDAVEDSLFGVYILV